MRTLGGEGDPRIAPGYYPASPSQSRLRRASSPEGGAKKIGSGGSKPPPYNTYSLFLLHYSLILAGPYKGKRGRFLKPSPKEEGFKRNGDYCMLLV